MNTQDFIKDLQKSNLYAECKCGEEFKLSDALLFDGLGKFPVEVQERKSEMEQALKDWREGLAKKKLLATKGAERTAKAVGIGKNIEKIVPTFKEFPLDLSDCRFLGDPIDILVFSGLTNNLVHSMSFIEVKSGGARLNANQKMAKEAVESNRVSYMVLP